MIKKFFRKEWSQEDIEEVEFSFVSREHDLSALEKLCNYLLVAYGVALISSFTSLETNWKNPFLVRLISQFIKFFSGGLILTSFCYITLYICDGILRRLEYDQKRNSWNSFNRKNYSRLVMWNAVFILLALSSAYILFFPLISTSYELSHHNFSNAFE